MKIVASDIIKPSFSLNHYEHLIQHIVWQILLLSLLSLLIVLLSILINFDYFFKLFLFFSYYFLIFLEHFLFEINLN